MDQLLAWFWSHVPVLSVLLPALTAVGLVLIGDPQGEDTPSRRVSLQRVLSIGAVVLGLLMSVALVQHAQSGEIVVYRVGEWAAPFGIVLILDRLSALMLLLTHVVALPALLYACAGWDRRGRFFHALFQFQLMGLCGAFVTGDLFNLFVFLKFY
jgi:multicomponent K+:H+ antiporter subunit D